MKKPILVVSLAVLLCFIFACQNKAEKAELEKFKTQAKIEEQNKGIARDLFKAIDEGNAEQILAFLADDFALTAPGVIEPLGRDMLPQLRNAHYKAFPDWRHFIEDVIADGDKVVVKLIQKGTHEAEYEGIPATGVKATMPAMHLLTIVDGKIKEMFAIEDYLGLNQQLGMELKPKEAGKK